MKGRAFLIVAALLVMVVSVACPAIAQDEEEAKPLGVGDTMADFSLMDAGGATVTSKDVTGGADKTAIVFMNTSCSACMMEAKVVEELSVGSGGKLGAFAILVDSRGADAAKSFQASTKFKNMKFLIDSDFTVPPLYGFSYTPAMILVDGSGKILMSKGGFGRKQAQKFMDDVKSHL